MKTRSSVALALVLAACAPAKAPTITGLVLRPTDSAPFPLAGALRAHPATVITFFSATCPCQRAHDARLRALIARESPLGVGFLVVDSEESSTSETDAEEARRRGFPIVRDEAGQLAHALDAEYATYSVVVDETGRVLYRGGFDSDRSHLKEARVTYLEDAIDDVLQHRPLRRPEAKALGCALQLR